MPVGQWVDAAILSQAGQAETRANAPSTADKRAAKKSAAKKSAAEKSAPTLKEVFSEPQFESQDVSGPENMGYAAPPICLFRRKLRWLAAGSLVFLLFLVAAAGLFWIVERTAPSTQIAGTDVKKQAGMPADALGQIRDAAKIGDREAQFDLAMRYAKGEWVPRDDLAAADLFEKAALQGHVEAQYRLGRAYEAGHGVAKNLFEAFFWFQSAADQGHLPAKFKAAVAYTDGIGIATDVKKAATLFGEAAEAGHAPAMARLADLYEQGKGLTQDPEAARLWRDAAAEVAALDAKTEKAAQTIILGKADPTGADPTETTPPLGTETIQTIEKLLVDLGFEPGPADGQTTDATREAIRLYQAFADLPVDGNPSQNLLEELRTVAAGMGAQ